MVVVDRQTDADGQNWVGTLRVGGFQREEKQHGRPALPPAPCGVRTRVTEGNAEPGPGRASGCLCSPAVPRTPSRVPSCDSCSYPPWGQLGLTSQHPLAPRPFSRV